MDAANDKASGPDATARRSASGSSPIWRPSSRCRRHAQRKRAKSHAHHLLVLHDVAHVAGARLGAMQALCTALGDHHDLHVLRRRLEAMDSRSGIEAELEARLKMITVRQDALAAKALAAGGRLFRTRAAAHHPDFPNAALDGRGRDPFGSSAAVRPAAP
ncbi:MAG TPA: CHAD domain-containing protein [Aurantimonas coralicida]|uniref:CHAD domain-containing protein n=1 Tax=Aurantimonas coralicida TaxID=182270 RepID=A0A9C9NDN3_9HYPH|nr:CHAD domain-containing protein [Aurantimonas coralicida]HET99992.1 CHAD domain-containing protein [Aurantimonas coralicida]